jgi:3-deoxy-manno-octulosonate cytidylyltransferase (CMP-KDO synthetase)
MKKIGAFIPARYAATRFPAKLMQLLGDKTVIRHTYDNTLATGLFDAVYVVTDSEIIFNEIVNHGGKAIMSKRSHESGSDRIAEAVTDLDIDIVVNASLMQVLSQPQLIEDPNYVKVAVDKNNNALFFSRSVIPYPRDKAYPTNYYEHIGVYAFQKQALLNFTQWPMSPLEAAEKIECLRYLENGVSIKMVITSYMGIEIDTPEDLIKAAALLK